MQSSPALLAPAVCALPSACTDKYCRLTLFALEKPTNRQKGVAQQLRLSDSFCVRQCHQEFDIICDIWKASVSVEQSKVALQH